MTTKDKLQKTKKESEVNPQLKKGYKRIQDEVLSFLLQVDLNKNELIVWLSIMKITWGWGEKSKVISTSQIVNSTGLLSKAVTRAIASLNNKNILFIEETEVKIQGGNYLKEFTLNKYYDTWNVKNRVRNDPINKFIGQPCPVIESNMTHYRVKNDSLLGQKRTPYLIIDNIDNINKYILPKWNKQNISLQKDLTASLSQELTKTLSLISEEELNTAIENYGKIYHSTEHYYSHKFKFDKFLFSGNMVSGTTKDKGYWMFLSENKPFEKFKLNQKYEKTDFKDYFEKIRLQHPLPKMAIKRSQRLSGITNNIYMGITTGKAKSSPVEAYELVVEPNLSTELELFTENHIIYVENIIIILLFQKKDEDFLKEMVELHLKLLKKFNLSEEILE